MNGHTTGMLFTSTLKRAQIQRTVRIAFLMFVEAVINYVFQKFSCAQGLIYRSDQNSVFHEFRFLFPMQEVRVLNMHPIKNSLSNYVIWQAL